jgi:Short C-terminal domain
VLGRFRRTARRTARRTSRRVARRGAVWGGEPAEESQRQPQTNPSNPDDPGYIVELRRLAELRGRGIITEEEFEAKKRRLLDL